jgi:hypothetical protein
VLPDAFEAGGNYTVAVDCPSCAGGVTSIWRTNITFGDVWVISGQSNAQLGMWSSFRQTEMDARALTGEFEWLRMWGSTNGGTNVSGNWMQAAAPPGSCRNASWAAPGRGGGGLVGGGLGETVGPRWCTPLDLMSPRPGDNGAPWFWQASQIGFFFAVSLRELLVEAKELGHLREAVAVLAEGRYGDKTLVDDPVFLTQAAKLRAGAGLCHADFEFQASATAAAAKASSVGPGPGIKRARSVDEGGDGGSGTR